MLLQLICHEVGGAASVPISSRENTVARVPYIPFEGAGGADDVGQPFLDAPLTHTAKSRP